MFVPFNTTEMIRTTVMFPVFGCISIINLKFKQIKFTRLECDTTYEFNCINMRFLHFIKPRIREKNGVLQE